MIKPNQLELELFQEPEGKLEDLQRAAVVLQYALAFPYLVA